MLTPLHLSFPVAAYMPARDTELKKHIPSDPQLIFHKIGEKMGLHLKLIRITFCSNET